jgi:predicted dienelactone hydrolase
MSTKTLLAASVIFTASLTLAASLSMGLGCSCFSVQADPALSDNGTQGNTIYQDWQDGQRGRSLPIKLYLPQSGSAPFPIVIFSHGLGGSREAAIYLGEYWSQRGYFCVFVQHPGSDSGVWKPALGSGREAMMQRMKEAANGKNAVDRAQDIKFVLDELARRNREDPMFKGKLQLNEIALAGHSFGAGTTLAIAGQNFGQASVKDDRVKAAIYLCPPVTQRAKASSASGYSNIQIPGLLMTGTEDVSPIGETKAEDRRVPYDGIKSPHQYLVNFIGANHSTFGGTAMRRASDSDERFHEMIDVVTTKFLDANLKNDASAGQWLDSAAMPTYLGKAAILERK